MAKMIIQVFRLDPPFPDVKHPNQTLYIDATAAQNLGMSSLVEIGEVSNILFIAGSKAAKMDAVLHSLEFPVGNIIRLSKLGLSTFHLKSEKRYWMEWDDTTKILKVIREVSGK